MPTFPAQYFTFSTRYPESGSRLQLGRSYMWSSEAEGPDQRRFILTVSGMTYFVDANDAPDRAKAPGRNMWVLEDFYMLHRLHEEFTFNHPAYGAVTCKFNRPLEVPAGVPGGSGTLPPFEVELLEIP